jgi:predicted O-linked N-acetylglucosamine transferase (SPINDLY family)
MHNVADRMPDTTRNQEWLVELLSQETGQDFAEGVDGLASVSLAELLAAVDHFGGNRGHPAVIAAYRRWIAANQQHAEKLYPAWFNLGVELSKSGDRKSAAAAYRTALALRPDFHQAAINLGLVLESEGQTDAALQIWEQAIQPDEARIALLNQRARLLEQLGRLDQAEQALRASLAANPKQPDAIQHWVHIRQKMCAWPILAGDIPGLTLAELIGGAGPLSGLAISDNVAVQRDIAANWIGRKTYAVPVRFSPEQGYQHDRIRVGYLSSDFCRHAMSYLIAELFERHDRSEFEVFGYCSSPDDGSELRQRVIAAFDTYRPIRDLSDEAAARLIRQDEIDILIDLNGLTSGARTQLLRWKPAPIQATYLGFVGPVPLPELDYLFCDDFVIPRAVAGAYQPTPLCIATNYQANDSKRAIGRTTSRSAAGLPSNRFVFCCFSNHYKITEDVFGAWLSILRQVDDAVLWLAADNQWSQNTLRLRAGEAGIDAERLIFAERTDPSLYMSRLSLADLFLDTFPYNAGTVASDAIRMQLPLITLSGQSFASRMAARFLTAIGADRGITTNLSDYIAAAVSLATDRDAYAAYKSLFGEGPWRRTLGDIATFAREFEATLIRISQHLARAG